MREIYVFADWQELNEPQFIGLLHSQITRGRETFSFEYSPQWLNGRRAMLLDPELRLFAGPQYLNDANRLNFGLFLDSSPDRWGQLLMKHREAIQARLENRRPRVLMGSDLMLGVHDEQRMGGLRFRNTIDGDFQSNEQGQTAPPWVRLRELEQAAWRFQSDEEFDDDESSHWLRLLMAPGSSIGGARPKAGVCDDAQNLWIAKFPGRNDQVDVGGWEMVAHRLAIASGLDVAEAIMQNFGGRNHTFMVKRFDRVVVGGVRARRHFASAMTMLGYSDGTSFKEGASYLEIVEFLTRYGADPEKDMHELWRRIVFSICVSNTDDHLRNHGFLLQPDGWKLSPAYDLNPDPSGTGLSLNISDADNSLNLDLAMEVADYFRLGGEEAHGIISHIRKVVCGWAAVANDLGISRTEQDRMRSAFRAASEK